MTEGTLEILTQQADQLTDLQTAALEPQVSSPSIGERILSSKIARAALAPFLAATIVPGALAAEAHSASADTLAVQSQAKDDVLNLNLTSGREWGPDNCMVNYSASGYEILVYQRTNLCEYLGGPSLDGVDYTYLYKRGSDESDWMERTKHLDGYTQFQYAGGPIFRQFDNGGNLQMLELFYNGTTFTTGYVDYVQYLGNETTGFTLSPNRTPISITLGEYFVSSVESQVYTPPISTPAASNLSTNQVQQAQAEQQSVAGQSKAISEQSAQALSQAPSNATQQQQENQVPGEQALIQTGKIGLENNGQDPDDCDTFEYTCSDGDA